jgi:hypothetical protein
MEKSALLLLKCRPSIQSTVKDGIEDGINAFFLGWESIHHPLWADGNKNGNCPPMCDQTNEQRPAILLSYALSLLDYTKTNLLIMPFLPFFVQQRGKRRWRRRL